MVNISDRYYDEQASEDLINFKLDLLVEVTRHGQRAPEKIFDLAKFPDQNF